MTVTKTAELPKPCRYDDISLIDEEGPVDLQGM